MLFEITQAQIEELTKIGEIYRETIYDPSLINLPSVINEFGNRLKELDGDISSSIVAEIFRFHKLISSNYTSIVRKRIDGLHRILSQHLPKDISFQILCRQKSWESALRKILSYYFEGVSINLSDVIALRIIIDSNKSEDEMCDICHTITDLCIDFFKHSMCIVMPPSKKIGDNPLYKDYIDNPKPNGYQSIHLSFMDKKNIIFEVQIRTAKMDIDSEFGPEDEVENNSDENNLGHLGYKYQEYSEFIPYISFDPKKVNKPFYRVYVRKGYTIITDEIGLAKAKSIEQRAHTF